MADRLPGHILDQAVDWAVKLESGQADHRDREACRAWRMEDSRHEAAWQSLGLIDREFEQIPQNLAGLAHSTLEKTPEQLNRLKARRRVVKALIMGAFAWDWAMASGSRLFEAKASGPSTPCHTQRSAPDHRSA